MKLTIITICYNAEQSIRKTVESVLNQTYQDIEYLIIDGASTDDTLEIVKEYTMNPKVHLFSEKDRGISDAFNKGIAKATGEYILFLNSGDYFLNENCLQKVAEVLIDNLHDIVTFSVRSVCRQKYPKDEKEGYLLWETSMIPHQGTFVAKKVFAKVGGFYETYKIRMDYDFFSRCYKENCSFFCIPLEIAYYDADGISANNHYLFEREGLAVRLLYKKEIEKADVDLMLKLSDKNGNDYNHYRVNLETDVCCNDLHRKELFWESEKVIIYGAGAAGFRLYNNLKEKINPTNIVICDSNKKGKYIEEFGQQIQSVDIIKEKYNKNTIIISIQDKLGLCEVYSSLIKVGVLERNIYIYDEDKVAIY